MPEPDLEYCVRQLKHEELKACIAQLRHEGRIGELHDADPRAGTLWHTLADALHTKNLKGQLLKIGDPLTQNAIATFAMMAACGLNPNYRAGEIGSAQYAALQTMQFSARKVPSWAKDAFSFYIEYYNAKLSGTENPDIAITTNDPIALQAIHAFLDRKDEFNFSEARQQQEAQQSTQPIQTAATLSPLTAIYPPSTLSGSAANCHKRRQAGSRTSTSEPASGHRGLSPLGAYR